MTLTMTNLTALMIQILFFRGTFRVIATKCAQARDISSSVRQTTAQLL